MRFKWKAQHEIAFGVCSALLLDDDVPEGPLRVPLARWRCFIGAGRGFESWEWLPTRTSKSALAYAYLKAGWTEVAADFRTGGAGIYRVHSQRAVCAVTATTSSAAASNIKGRHPFSFAEVAEHV